MSDNKILVTVLMGSANDHDVLVGCRKALDRFGIAHEAKVLSAHRTPDELVEYLGTVEERGCKIIIAAAGMAAHLGGVVAAHSRLPVLGIPIPEKSTPANLSCLPSNFCAIAWGASLRNHVIGLRWWRSASSQPLISIYG